jgi:hypothetical protein
MVIARTIIVRAPRGYWVPFFFPMPNDFHKARCLAEYIYLRERRAGRGLQGLFAQPFTTSKRGRSMRWTLWKSWSVIFVMGLAWAMETPRVYGQTAGTSRSLGGYGAASAGATASMGSSSPMIPYAGSFGGFMPYRMSGGGDSGLSISTRGSSLMESPRSSFSLAPMSSGMGSGFGPRTRSPGTFSSQGLRGDGARGLMSQPMGGGTGTRSVMPPNFGYPFYQPPSLLLPASSAAGMSM